MIGNSVEEFIKRTKREAYELVVAIIIGEQSEVGWNSPEYEALQRVLERVREEEREL